MQENQPVEKTTAVVEAALQHHGTNRDELIPILNEINQQIGYLPAASLEKVSQALRIPKSQLFSSATFYRMLSITPRGRHVIQFCESAPCHVEGGRQVWHTILDELGILPGETSKDGRWTLETTSCLGICGVGPVLLVDEDIYGNVRPEQVAEILARYA
ncbi:MAG: NADH-quinone oxidoreductase subunit NuoE [Chloroflexi bacterium]|nr:NADH-quinone oxidoreductase subunit NuoE [Chloroflexota bacterium]